MRFCGGHCYLDHWLIIGFHIQAIFIMIFLLVYADLAANFGVWSVLEAAGLYTQLVIISLYLVILIWVIVFFHNYRRKHYRQERLFFINMWLCILYLTGVASPYLMLRDPTRREMKEYLHHLTFGAKGELLNSFQQLQQEKKCCGIDKYLDFCWRRNRTECGSKIFPVTCCKKGSLRKGNCRVNVSSETDTMRLYQMGCVPKGASDFKNTKVYARIRLVKGFAVIPLLSPLITIILIQLIIALTKPKVLQSEDRKSKTRAKELRVMFPSEGASNDRQEGEDVTQDLMPNASLGESINSFGSVQASALDVSSSLTTDQNNQSKPRGSSG